MKQGRYKTSGMTQIICIEDDKPPKMVRLYVKDLMAEIKLIAVMALIVFGLIFAVPMVRNEFVYIAYWALTFFLFGRVMWQRFYKGKKKRMSSSHNR